jgi:uncharacterized RDD family membrane protein YckC
MTVYKFAGFWRRFVAFMIDSTMVTIIFVVLCGIAGLAFFFGAMSANNSGLLTDLVKPKGFSSVVFLILGFYIAINIAYFTYFHGTTGRTPGKMLLGLQVYCADGTEVSFGIAFLRAVGYLVSSLLFTIPLGFIWAAFDKKKQAWHDKVAGTVVIIKEQENESAGLLIPDGLPVVVVAPPDRVQDDPAGDALTTATQTDGTNNQKIP